MANVTTVYPNLQNEISPEKEKLTLDLKMKKVSPGGSSSAEKRELEKAERREECRRRLVTKFKILWCLISCLISIADVAVIIVLSYLHFIHEHDIIAWLMLLPILLNFIGIFTFLSNEKERKELETLAGSCRGSALIKNLMVFPVVGPTFSTMRLLAYAFEEKNAEQFERLESLVTKMKQYESFFRAAPEAFIQMTYRIVSYDPKHWEPEDRWTTLCIVLCVFSLAESHMYGIVRPYYRMFIDSKNLPEHAWNVEKISIRWRVLIFLFTYFSICARLGAESLWRAAACFLFSAFSFGEVIAMTFIFQFVLRATIHGLLLRRRENYMVSKGTFSPGVHSTDSGTMVYRALTYSWRSCFLSFDFQSPDKLIQGWFYFEIVLMAITSYASVFSINFDLEERPIFIVYSVGIVVTLVIAMVIRVSVAYCMRRGKNSRNSSVESRENNTLTTPDA